MTWRTHDTHTHTTPHTPPLYPDAADLCRINLATLKLMSRPWAFIISLVSLMMPALVSSRFVLNLRPAA